MSDATPCVFMWWIVLDNFGSILFVISSSDFVYRGHNWLKGICNFSPLISSAVKLLKHMLHHLPNLRCHGFPFLVPFQHCILTHMCLQNSMNLYVFTGSRKWLSFCSYFLCDKDPQCWTDYIKVTYYWAWCPARWTYYI